MTDKDPSNEHTTPREPEAQEFARLRESVDYLATEIQVLQSRVAELFSGTDTSREATAGNATAWAHKARSEATVALGRLRRMLGSDSSVAVERLNAMLRSDVMENQPEPITADGSATGPQTFTNGDDDRK